MFNFEKLKSSKYLLKQQLSTKAKPLSSFQVNTNTSYDIKIKAMILVN